MICELFSNCHSLNIYVIFQCILTDVSYSSLLLLVTGQLADTPTRGLDDSQTGHPPDWSTRGLDNSRTGQVADATIDFACLVFACETASCPVRDLSSPRVV